MTMMTDRQQRTLPSRPRQLRLILDAGASVSNDGLSRLDRVYKTVLIWDALPDLGARLPSAFHLAHPRTLRRWLLVRDADLLVTASHRIVVLDFDRRRPWLRPLLQRFNEAEVALPWLARRRVVMGFAARSQRLSDARPVLPKPPEVGSGLAEGCGGVGC
jgi:hypothetical protein